MFRNPDNIFNIFLGFALCGIRLNSGAADEALEEVYLRLLKSPDWRAASDDIWNLFAAYGCGGFLKSRLFFAEGETLVPAESIPWLCPVSFYDEQRAKLTESVIVRTPLLIPCR